MGLGNNGLNDGAFFNVLYDTVFPFVGDFFGKICALFDCTYSRFNAWINNFGAPLNVLNLFNGEITTWKCPEVFRLILSIPISLYGTFMELFLPSYVEQPLWACFVIGSLLILFFAFVASRIIHFIKSLIGLGG